MEGSLIITVLQNANVAVCLFHNVPVNELNSEHRSIVDETVKRLSYENLKSGDSLFSETSKSSS